MVFSEEIEEIIVALIPEKFRKIIGSILLIFGTVVFLWEWQGQSVKRTITHTFHANRKDFPYPKTWSSMPWHRT